MSNFELSFWTKRVSAVASQLQKNNFKTHIVQNSKELLSLIKNTLLPEIKPQSVSWGGSTTFTETGIYDWFIKQRSFDVLDTYDKSISREAMLERRRQALLVDFFITGTNAITEKGHLVNLDMIGNRVSALTFGPKNVLVLCGRNKIVKDQDQAFTKIKKDTAPANVMRLKKKTPCLKTSFCHDCSSPDRICNTWTITEKSFPQERIIVVLINQNLGI